MCVCVYVAGWMLNWVKTLSGMTKTEGRINVMMDIAYCVNYYGLNVLYSHRPVWICKQYLTKAYALDISSPCYAIPGIHRDTHFLDGLLSFQRVSE